MEKLNKFWIGILSGMLVPLIFIFIFIQLRYQGDMSFSAVIKQLYVVNGITAMLAVAVMPNLLAFYFFLNRELWKAGKGIIFSVMLYGLAVLYLYFSKS